MQLWLSSGIDWNLLNTVQVLHAPDRITRNVEEELQNWVSSRIGETGLYGIWAFSSHDLDNEKYKTYFQNVNTGDVFLLCNNTDRCFEFMGRVVHKFISDKLGLRFWKIEQGKKWKYIFLLDNVERVCIDKEELNEDFGYQRGFPLQSAIPVKTDHLLHAFRKYRVSTMDALLEKLRSRPQVGSSQRSNHSVVERLMVDVSREINKRLGEGDLDRESVANQFFMEAGCSSDEARKLLRSHLKS